MGLYPPGLVAAGKFHYLPVLAADARRLRRLSLGQCTPLPIPHTTSYPEWSSCSEITIDIETVGHTRAIACVGVAGPDGPAHVLTWSQSLRDWLSEALHASPLIIGHNLAFDLPRLASAGVRVPATCRLFDTFHAAHLLLPDFYKGLERVASLYLDIHRWKHLSDVDPILYNATDVVATRALRARFADLLHEYDLDRCFARIAEAIRPLISMSERGILVDAPRLAAWRNELSASLRVADAHWVRLAGAVNPGSPAQVTRFFYGKPRGAGWADEEALSRLTARRPSLREPVSALLARRKVSKLLSTYASITLGTDGCVHPQFLPFDKEAERGTAATGRLAATDPNIQNQPLPARRIFIARPGLRLYEFDYSQIELRIAARLSNDPVLLDALRGDVHARTMALMGCDRVRAKNVTYGTLYGAAPSTLAGILTTSGFPTTIDEARALQAAFAAAYPVLWRWRTAVAVLGAQQGYLANPFGRRRWFHGNYLLPSGEVEGPTVTEMFDYLPQSTAADIMWSRLVPVDRLAAQAGGAVLAQVHDSFLFELPPSPCEAVAEIRDAMEAPVPEIAPDFVVPVSIKSGVNWGEMEAYECPASPA